MQIWWGWEGVVAVGGGYMVNLEIYHKTPNMRRTLEGNKIADLSDFILDLSSGFKGFGKESRTTYENLLSFGIWCGLYMRLDGML